MRSWQATQGACFQFEKAARLEMEEFSVRLRPPDTKEAITAFFEKRLPDYPNKTNHLGRMIRNVLIKKVKQS